MKNWYSCVQKEDDRQTVVNLFAEDEAEAYRKFRVLQMNDGFVFKETNSSFYAANENFPYVVSIWLSSTQVDHYAYKDWLAAYHKYNKLVPQVKGKKCRLCINSALVQEIMDNHLG